METDEEKSKKLWEIRMFRLAVYETPGTILVLLGAYGKFWADGDAFWSALNNPTVVNVMLAIGITIWLASWTEFIKMIRNKH
tara:strand:+ start:1984 stop:2229 length:246 start_codon:yes stop_codon:yes gene_type:complete